jgi:hypothetical protein
MSPQPAANNTEVGSVGARQIERAKRLEAERARIMKAIGANREFLRGLALNEELTPEQEDWVEDFYPTKEKGERRSAEEIERTKLAKAEARKAAQAK